ncbi:hypothetical protein VNO77_19548 [Canavalia gladiata]|uniref:Receptor-like serine/threonine-protein kinase n=1 Tax=Canavalia gladiata TaxID=3824 RepID=A0AAN9QKJ7_CANGL
MAFSISLFFLLFLLPFHFHTSSSLYSLNKGSSLSVEKHREDVILSKNLVFSAGFFQLGLNAFSFSIWFNNNHSHPHTTTTTVVWMANREQPVNGRFSKLSLSHTGNILLIDAGQYHIWSSDTESHEPMELLLENDGNLVLREKRGTVLWQSFDFPTDTLLPGQPLTRYTHLVSSRSQSNYSSGFYKLLFDDNNVLRLVYDGPQVSSTYWPLPWIMIWEAGRYNYNSSRIAVLNSLGKFISSDNYTFSTNDHGMMMQRRLTLDSDGNVRVYSKNDASKKWYVSWQFMFDTCTIHGICGANSICSYDPKRGRRCSCLPGYGVKNNSDWSYGCQPVFNLTCNGSESFFLAMQGVEFYGYDNHYVDNGTYMNCTNLCLQNCNCKGFQYRFNADKNTFSCFTKLQLLNGRISPSYNGTMYLRVPKGSNFPKKEYMSECVRVVSVMLDKDYVRKRASHFVRFFLWLATAVGGLEMVCFLMIWGFLIRTRQKSSTDKQGYHLKAVEFRKFSYSELKKATKGFGEEIGRGAGGVVYKGILSDQRKVAIKRLNEAKQGEGEFLAEVSIIGRLNHMNLIEMWGYCAEGKHRLLVYEYMESGSLAENLSSNTLDWSKRYNIALGMARVLAYLHEECLEWILHCDIKPENILLDSNYLPKVADFGLSKLLNRNKLSNPNFSMIRGTRGYMAPEWLYNLPITSKVDVYSYGIVLLELITGNSPTMDIETVDGTEAHHGRLVTWVREKKRRPSWVKQILDPSIGTNYDENKIEILARVALDCVEEDKDVRPTMKQVVEMLQSHESDTQ